MVETPLHPRLDSPVPINLFDPLPCHYLRSYRRQGNLAEQGRRCQRRKQAVRRACKRTPIDIPATHAYRLALDRDRLGANDLVPLRAHL